MITRRVLSKSLAFRTCLVCRTETYVTKITAIKASKPETGSGTKVASKRAAKPRVSEHEAGNDSENDEDTLPDKITASTKFTLKQWKEYGGKIYEKRLKYLVKAKNIAKAMETLQVMKDRKVNISLLAYNMLISQHTRTGDIKKAFKLFNELKKRSLFPDEYTYTSLFKGCGVAGPTSLDIFDKITAEMERREVIPNTVTCNAMIKALVMCEEPVKAFKVYYESMMSTYTPPDLHTYSSLLMASMIKTNDNGMELAKDVWSELKASDLPPDVHCYDMLIQCLRDCTYSDDSLVTEFDGKDDSEFSKQGFFEGYIELAFTEDFVLRLFVSKDGIRRLSLAGVEAIIEAMEKDSVKPDIKTFHFLTSLVSRNAYKHILKLVEKHQVSVDIAFMNRLTSSAAAGLQKSMELLKQSGLTPNVYTYQTMASGCRSGKQALKLLSVIRENGHTPSDVEWETFFSLCAKGQDYDSLLQLMRKMKFMRCHPNDKIISILDRVARRKGSGDKRDFLDYYKSWKTDVRRQ